MSRAPGSVAEAALAVDAAAQAVAGLVLLHELEGLFLDALLDAVARLALARVGLARHRRALERGLVGECLELERARSVFLVAAGEEQAALLLLHELELEGEQRQTGARLEVRAPALADQLLRGTTDGDCVGAVARRDLFGERATDQAHVAEVAADAPLHLA